MEGYNVVYSGVARAALEDLFQKARSRQLAKEALHALREIERLLALYPQFGEPVLEHASLGITEYVGQVWQIVLRYGVDEQRRIVHVAPAPKPLPYGPLSS